MAHPAFTIVEEQIFERLQGAGRSHSMPDVATTAMLALSILDTVQETRRNEEQAFIAIGKEACGLAINVIDGVGPSVLDPPTGQSALELQTVQTLLREVNDLLKKYIERRRPWHGNLLFWRRPHIATARECRTRLHHASVKVLELQLPTMRTPEIQIIEQTTALPPTLGNQQLAYPQSPGTPGLCHTRNTSRPEEHERVVLGGDSPGGRWLINPTASSPLGPSQPIGGTSQAKHDHVLYDGSVNYFAGSTIRNVIHNVGSKNTYNFNFSR